MVYADIYGVYDILDVSEFHHFRINHKDAFVKQMHNHINGIKKFWNQAKRQFRRYNGIPEANFHLFIKKAEFPFNYGSTKAQLCTLREWVKLEP